MRSLERNISDALRRLRAGDTGVLLSVESTAGSAPRDAGTAMLVLKDDVIGTIGGGALEHAAINRARDALSGRGAMPDEETIPLGPVIGQCCGGTVVLRYRVQDALNHGNVESWLEGIDASTQVWLFGAGHVGKAVVQAMAPLGFAITWIDSRPEMLQDIAPIAKPLASRAPHLEISGAPAGTMVLVMTHSHAQDFDIIDAALKRVDLGFVGLIGSATKRARFISRLKARGHSEQAIGRLNCPIGIAGITGKEPEVIAASLAAQLLRQRETMESVKSPPISMTG